MTPQELLQLAIEACDGEEMDLARQLGLTMTTATTQFGRWRRGETKPGYDTTMRLLELAGLLRRPEDLKKNREVLDEVKELRAELERVARRRRVQ